MNEIKLNKAEIQTRFNLNQKVVVIGGFYKRFKGRIQDVSIDNNKVFYKLEVSFNNRMETIKVPEEFLKSSLF